MTEMYVVCDMLVLTGIRIHGTSVLILVQKMDKTLSGSEWYATDYTRGLIRIREELKERQDAERSREGNWRRRDRKQGKCEI